MDIDEGSEDATGTTRFISMRIAFAALVLTYLIFKYVEKRQQYEVYRCGRTKKYGDFPNVKIGRQNIWCSKPLSTGSEKAAI